MNHVVIPVSGVFATISQTVKMVPAKGFKQGDSGLVKGQIRIRGASSQAYEKKSFSLKLDQPTDWLGLHKNRDWVLNAAFVDCSMMRHKLSYDLFQSLSTDGWTRRSTGGPVADHQESSQSQPPREQSKT